MLYIHHIEGKREMGRLRQGGNLVVHALSKIKMFNIDMEQEKTLG